MMLQFNAKITQIGQYAADALEDNMLILFNQTAPDDVADYCFIHDQGNDVGIISTDSTLLLGGYDYVVTAVGSIANRNLETLGHITIKFDAQSVAEYPGTIHVIGQCPKLLRLGDCIVFG